MPDNGTDGAFLRDQLDQLEHKMARLHDALDASGDHLEAEGVKRLLTSAEREREVLGDLVDRQTDGAAVSLDALILQQIARFRRAAQRANSWRIGQHTPSEYWDAEVKATFLTKLLGLYHAYHASRSYYQPAPSAPASGEVDSEDVRLYPWYFAPSEPSHEAHHEDVNPPNAAGVPESLGVRDLPDALAQQIQSILEKCLYPRDHLNFIIQPDDPLIVTGYAHSAEIREYLLDLIMDLDGVQEVLADIKVVDPVTCPACLASNTAQRDRAAGPANEERR
jgi:hypothetical protein